MFCYALSFCVCCSLCALCDVMIINLAFLAPTGALGVKMSSVCVRDVLLPSAISESGVKEFRGVWGRGR